MSEPAASGFQSLGAHSIAIEGCILHIRLVGDLTQEQVTEILHIAAEIHAREGLIFTLNDISRLQRLLPETRRYAAHWMRSHPFNGGALYGGGLASRTVMTLLVRAINLVRTKQVLTHFTETEQESRAWLALQIQKLRAHSRP